MAGDPLVVGRFASQESASNDIAVSDPEFIGVDPFYKTERDHTFEPFAAASGPEQALDQRAKDWQVAMAAANVGIGHLGYVSDYPHPASARQPAADLIDKGRLALNHQAGL